MTKSYIVADSGTREKAPSGMVRDSRQEKGRFDLVSPIAMRRLALVYERGAAKYAARNWEMGRELSRFLDSAKRHINDYELIASYQRESVSLEQLPADVNPHEDHLAQAVWNLFALIHLETIKPELDDLNEVRT